MQLVPDTQYLCLKGSYDPIERGFSWIGDYKLKKNLGARLGGAPVT